LNGGFFLVEEDDECVTLANLSDINPGGGVIAQ